MSWIDQRPDDAMDGAFDALGSEGVATVPAGVFREAMSRLGAAVHVVTTDGAGGKAGFTATALASVSDQPPTLLVCLNRRSQITPVLQRNGVLCVNTLGADGSATADVFAGRTGTYMAERFESGQWGTLTTGSPVLMSAVVAFDCRIVDMKPVASHNVFFAGVEAVHMGPPGPALVYLERGYRRV